MATRALTHTSLVITLLWAGCGSDANTARGSVEVAPTRLLEADEPPGSLSEAAIDALVATAGERARSASIAERVVRNMGANRDPSFMGVPEDERPRWRGATVEEAVARVRERTTVERRGESLVLEVAVTDADPERAITLCNEMIQAIVDASLERQHAPITRRIEWLDARLRELRERRREAEGGPEADELDGLLERVTQESTEASLERGRARQPLTVLDRCRSRR